MNKPIQVVGSSMGARILSGERVGLASLAVEELAVGDVVAFVDERGLVVAHRLVAIERRPEGVRLRTRGDGARAEDALWSREALVGRVSHDGALGRAIAGWPRLAVPLGAALRVRRAWDLPSAVLAAAIALAIEGLRTARRRQ